MSLPIETDFANLLQNAFEHGDVKVAEKTVEQENVLFLQKLYEALLKGDLDSFAEFFSPEAEMELFCPAEFKFIKRAKGRDEIVKAAVHNFSTLKDQQTELLSVLAQGDTIIFVAQEKGIFRDTNKSYNACFMQQFTIGDGLVTHTRQVTALSE